MMGIILNTVAPIERPVACSLSVLIETLFGYIPGPYVYGLIQDLTKKTEYPGSPTNVSPWGMRIMLWSSSIGAIFLALALATRKKPNNA
jgi:hypothetical protein